ncbi:MAG TPA: right-handed parallel beta-helix repeat-containing protein [Solirubrobacteraceae bacterium]|nr:right-handed parallel beta-helix repeat-containing protein [Solirubrobacteraceae bacterium]
MFKQSMRAPVALVATFAVLVLLTASSAVASSGAHPARAHAGDGRAHARHARRHAPRQLEPRPSRAGDASSFAPAQTQPTILLGDRAVEPQTDSLAPGRAGAFRVRALSSGAVRTIYVYLAPGSAAGSLSAGIYRDAHGHPGALLASGAAAMSAPGSWSPVPIPRTTLVSGATYWLAVLGKGGALRYRDRLRGPCASEASSQSSLTALPASWRTGASGASCPLSAYATSTASVPAKAGAEAPAPGPKAPGGSGETSTNPLEPVAPVLPPGNETPALQPSPVEPAPPVEPPPVESPPVESPPVEPPPVELPVELPVAPVDLLPPTVSGTAIEGETLTAGHGTWAGDPASYAYRWQRCDGAGGNCSNIAGATTSERVLSSADVGHTLRVRVTASNQAGSTEAGSAPSAAVAAKSTGGGAPGGGAPEPTCTVETESVATAKSDLAIDGEVVCLKETGSAYPSIAITAGPPSTNSTLVPAPGRHVSVKSVTIAASHITVEGLHIEGGIDVGTGNSTAYSHDVIAWNDISNPSGDGVGVFARVEGPVAEFIDIEHNKIHNTSVTSEGDAIHAQGWANLTVRENDIYAISEETCKGACHDDIFQTYNAGYRTAHDFVFEKNYVHDNDTEGILLKDGDTVTNATIRDNLMIRDERWGGIAGVWVDDCTHGLVIERNTLTEGNNIQPLSSSCVEPSAVIRHNVLGRIKLGGESASGTYALTSEGNLFAENPAGLYRTGPGDETKSLSGSGTYKCSPTCKVGSDDYRLAANPKEAGIDWNPGEQSWGPNQ